MPSFLRLVPAAVLFAAAFPDSATCQRPSDATTAFVNVTVVPLDRERTLDRQTVVVKGDRIVAMGPAASTAVPGDANRIDGSGKYLMPGLAEMHAHVVGGNNPNHEQINRDILFLYVANGITSIRAMLGAPNQLPLREQLRRGEVLGPTMYVSAPSLNGNSAPNPDTAVKLVRAHKAAGYDFLKIHPGLSVATYDAIVATAREQGITWAGHVPAAVGLQHAIESGQSTVDHLDGILEATVPDSTGVKQQNGTASFAESINGVQPSRFAALAQQMKARGVWNVPTILVWENLYTQAESPEEMGARAEMKYWPKQAVANFVAQKRNSVGQMRQQGITPELAAKYLALRRQALKAVVDAGAPLLMGTDSPQLFMVPGFALHRELGIIASAGVTPYQIYESGAKNVARYVAEHLKQDGRFGTVAVGNHADLVLLDANPLESVANLTKRSGVMVRGRWVSSAEIEKGLADLATRYAQ
ncbi:MAG TPA: amidohydrolase family protein [Gemmatimonadaceae bacterium]|nr:amidohydrolase family protein [Gemmatimonadaceae bacterium]